MIKSLSRSDGYRPGSRCFFGGEEGGGVICQFLRTYCLCNDQVVSCVIYGWANFMVFDLPLEMKYVQFMGKSKYSEICKLTSVKN